MLKRRREILLLVLLMFGQGAMFLTYFALYVFNVGQRPELMAFDPRGHLQAGLSLWFFTGTWLVLGVASVLIGVGLRRLRPWAWTAALTLEGAILILALEAYFNKHADMSFYVAMMVAVVVVFALNQREAQILYKAQLTSFEGPFGK
ncbi:MAG: hypothetical protein HYZ49_07755 [Chloroflexi bacterium]|nr:hypothetical protein [Chloroflexota bacterium]